MNDAPDRDHHRPIRLPGYDYAQTGAYFVTICTNNRECLFGDVVDGVMVLNAAGKMIQQVWAEIPLHVPNADIDAFVVMPNHIHGIIVLTNAGTVHRATTRVAPTALTNAGTSVGAGLVPALEDGANTPHRATTRVAPTALTNAGTSVGAGLVPALEDGANASHRATTRVAPTALTEAGTVHRATTRVAPTALTNAGTNVGAGLVPALEDGANASHRATTRVAPTALTNAGTNVGAGLVPALEDGANASHRATTRVAPTVLTNAGTVHRATTRVAPTALTEAGTVHRATTRVAPTALTNAGTNVGAGLVPALEDGANTPHRATTRVAPTALTNAGTVHRATTRVAPTGLGNLVGAFKSRVTVEYIRGVKRKGWLPFHQRLWQRNYYEHIVRDENSLTRIREYIINNPLQWDMDRDNPVNAARGVPTFTLPHL